ncbi:pepsin-like aspartic protease [Aspergillus clavatus NRRL 1]|uniref:Aspergillopepsin-1 n=1 Tax=Aspergillus clavatus (strain ATCC 1007 / CBS 513.65 / DSM 816 / NCTC 3887 / NRRL 1 / QM 1276 / 107) TaxID=344612 RepID=PEPA_ASPCL|nr:aspartic endopeptidase Pep1 [Aspergillus clavatus NRRL 1]A1CBR4.1 RecName: Full=Aspergillopepsin-1; AltName: Full=Aspartic protease pepA; AltName: Full=Aspergillopepsin I; AltName: Full=Aspergillopeptidase A; Flags: Precursor [Aspergillus clavatus NRRL 1]EAW13182.1 aspartic endopeptidase Pep1 [Aspergillus clavatus NRRL 1]
MVVFSKVTAAVFGLATIASAAPAPPTRKGFTVQQQARPAQKKQVNLPAMYAHALTKFGGSVPESVKVAASKGSAVTTPEAGDVEYLTPVNVGGTVMNLDFDTGSADLWVFSGELPASETSGHSVYKPGRTASKLPGGSWQISYGDGSSASGDVYKDTVVVGGVTAHGQAVEAAAQISSQFLQDKNNDGLLGLAFSSLNTVQPQPQTTFFDTVKSSLDRPLFAVTLKHNAPGSFDFGYIDHSKYTGEIAYTDVDNSQGFWSFTADGYSIGGGQSSGSSISGIADTGTTLLLLDDNVVSDFYQHVEGAQNSDEYGGYVFPCSAKVPSFTTIIGGYKAVTPGKLINYGPVTDGSSTCYGGIQSSGGVGQNIFGDIFLKSQFVVFDSEGPRLGFAAQA